MAAAPVPGVAPDRAERRLPERAHPPTGHDEGHAPVRGAPAGTGSAAARAALGSGPEPAVLTGHHLGRGRLRAPGSTQTWTSAPGSCCVSGSGWRVSWRGAQGGRPPGCGPVSRGMRVLDATGAQAHGLVDEVVRGRREAGR